MAFFKFYTFFFPLSFIIIVNDNHRQLSFCNDMRLQMDILSFLYLEISTSYNNRCELTPPPPHLYSQWRLTYYLICSWAGSNSITCWVSADSAWCMKGSGMIDTWRSSCLTLPLGTQICPTCNWPNGLSDRKPKR